MTIGNYLLTIKFYIMIKCLKKMTIIFMSLFMLTTYSSKAQGLIQQGFEAPCPGSNGNEFFDGCVISNTSHGPLPWISTSGTPNVTSEPLTAFEGTHYAHMAANYRGFRCNSFNGRGSSRSEGIAMTNIFYGGETYVLTFQMQWKDRGPTSALNFDVVLANRLVNVTGSLTGCAIDNGVAPLITDKDTVIYSTVLTGITTDWQQVQVTFTPQRTTSYFQLWFRAEAIGDESGDSLNDVYIDDVKIENCTRTIYTPEIERLNINRNSSGFIVDAIAETNPVPVNHRFSVHISNGTTDDGPEVPGNAPVFIFNQTDANAVFSNNLRSNQIFYIKHGIWNDCIGWREDRKLFILRSTSNSSVNPEYEIEFLDSSFKPSKEYLAEMTKRALSGDFDIEERNNNEIVNENKITVTNYPNPFSNNTTIEYTIESEGPVSINVLNNNGQVIETLLNNVQNNSGTHQVVFDRNNLSSGIYFYRITAGEYSETKKMILID